MAKRGANDKKILDYPVGIGVDQTGITGQPYMLLTSYESKNAIESTGQVGQAGDKDYNPGKILSSIALYIPPNGLRTAFDANWGGLEGGAMRATMGGALSRLNFGAFDLSKASKDRDWSAGNISSTLFEGIKSAGLVAGGKVAGAIDKGTGMLAAQGIAVNNHMALAYKGPGEFRTHDFAFNFFPKAKQDSEVIRNILQDLENGMLPRMAGPPIKSGRTLSAPFFMAPRHWTIDFFQGNGKPNEYLHKIKKSVIKQMQINHDPNSTISFHEDGSPVQTSLTLTFQEIELPTSSDDATERNKEIKDELDKQKANLPPENITASN